MLEETNKVTSENTSNNIFDQKKIETTIIKQQKTLRNFVSLTVLSLLLFVAVGIFWINKTATDAQTCNDMDCQATMAQFFFYGFTFLTALLVLTIVFAINLIRKTRLWKRQRIYMWVGCASIFIVIVAAIVISIPILGSLSRMGK